MTERILNHTDKEWVAKAGLSYLQSVSEYTLQLPLTDFLVIITYIYEHANQKLTGLRIALLNSFEEAYPDYIATLSSLEQFMKVADKSAKLNLATILNKVLHGHHDEIVEHVTDVANQKRQMAFSGLFTMATYVMDEHLNDRPIKHSELIWETMRLIAQKLPQNSEYSITTQKK